jgi:hypothetical protein
MNTILDMRRIIIENTTQYADSYVLDKVMGIISRGRVFNCGLQYAPLTTFPQHNGDVLCIKSWLHNASDKFIAYLQDTKETSEV